jgi:hypothetical protein
MVYQVIERRRQAKSIVEESEPSKMNCDAILVEELTEVLSRSVDDLRDGGSWRSGVAKVLSSVGVVVAPFMSIRHT